MAQNNFLPIITNNLAVDFPELRHYILYNSTKILSYRNNEKISFSTPSELLYLVNGKVKSYILTPNGGEKLVYIFVRDTIIFQSFSNRFFKTLIACDDTTAFFISESLISKFLQTNTTFIEKYIALIKERSTIMLSQVFSDSNQSARQKVLSFLISLANSFGVSQENGTLIITEMPTLTDLAALINVHRTNVSTYINELEKMQIIERQKKALIIKDLQALQRKLDETEAE